jgi:hypothetical protein
VGGAIHSLARVNNNIIEIGFDYVLEIVKHEGHSSLEGDFDIFKAERHLRYAKVPQRTNKCHLMLILGLDLDLVLS